MVAPGGARDLLLRLGPHERRHPWDLYWIWVFSTEKRWWQEARRRFLVQEAIDIDREHAEPLLLRVPLGELGIVLNVEHQAEPETLAVTLDYVGRTE